MKPSLRVFYQNVFTHLLTTGSVAPSSRFLAEAITRCVQPQGEPLCILEAGPGTGPFTRALIGKLREEDRLDLCELNDLFVQYLQKLLETDSLFTAHKKQITLYHCPVEELAGEQRYDYIISGLPFNNFPPELVSRILQNYKRLIKPGGILAFFEYAGIRRCKQAVVWGKEGQRIQAISAVLQQFFKEYKEKDILVWLNFPPSVVHVCRMR